VADTATAFGALAELFILAGHERLVYVGGPEGSWQDVQRTAAVRAAAQRLGAELGVIGPYPSTFAAGIEAARAIRDFAPDAVIPYATAIGLGIQHAYLAAGDRPPVVSSERAIVEALDLRGVPAIDVDGWQLGSTAAELLVARIASPQSPPERSRLAVPVDRGL
jgi:DNA-binding LacI/PurR family transcriptional regulator